MLGEKMDKIQVTEDIEIEEHELEDFVRSRVQDMDIDSLKSHAFDHLVEYYKENPQDLEDYFED